MKVLKGLIVAVALLVVLGMAAFIVAGLTLPSERSYVNEVEINAPADKLWQVVTDKARYTEWQTVLERVEIVDERTWIEYPTAAPPLNFSLVADSRPVSMEFRYTMGNYISGQWKGEVTVTASGVRLRTTDGYTADGWLAKVLLYAFFDLDKFAKAWNHRLKKRVESLN